MSHPAFSIKAADLVRAMGRVAGAIPSRATIPILMHVEIVAGAGEISIRATSLDLEAITSVAAEVTRPGSVTVHGQTLSAIASKMPKSGAITLDCAADTAKLTCGRSSYDLATLPAEDFPERRDPGKGAATITIDAADLKSLIAATLGSAGTESGRIYLCGIHLTMPKNGGTLIAVATDGHELVRATAPVSGATLPPNIIVPSAAAKMMRDIADEGEVTITTDDRRIMATAGADTISASLIEGNYPDYERVIPKPNGSFATVMADHLASAADRAMAVFTGANVLGSRIGLTADADGISIAAAGPLNRALEHVEADCSPHTLACDGTKLKGLLAHWGEKPVMIQQDNPSSAILIRSDADASVVQVLMPMK